ncbi:ABC transporter substrate-binding protein [Lutibaculum baratangense]|uniref:ABC transporter, periplasmic protein n=1 Tax=Lutibaculum baratangense AMV1 TaxID=631454 RepID=V4TI56_9HYPH|nr:ABC transporter substrate-binding protein [Lutibaculum baratangense]ESR25688.1 ABC transporter, periplasmic protein [Lutibaculum baratangense AMV1]
MVKYRFGADLALSATMPRLGLRSRETLKVGVLAPFTGDAASWGLPGLHACLIWAEWCNKAGGVRIGGRSHEVEIKAFDDRYDPSRALRGIKHLVQEEGVRFVLMLGGDTVPAIARFLTETKTLAATLLPSDLSPDIPYLIAPCEVHPIYLVTGVDWIARNRPEMKRAAICAQKDALGLPSVATYRAAFEVAGIDVVKEILFPGSLQDVDSMIDVLLENEPDILCWDTAYEPFVHALTEAAHRRGFRGQLLSCTCDDYPALVARTGADFMEGFLFHFPDFDDPALQDPGVGFARPRAFFDEFNLRYPGEWSAVPWEYFSILDMWRKAVERAQTVETATVLGALKTGGIGRNVFGEARWWGDELFGIDHALVGNWPVVRIECGKARIVEFGSILDWWDRHGEALVRHMRIYGQMWDQRYDRLMAGQAAPVPQNPPTSS